MVSDGIAMVTSLFPRGRVVGARTLATHALVMRGSAAVARDGAVNDRGDIVAAGDGAVCVAVITSGHSCAERAAGTD
ncbi:Hypothetical protein A7982_07231 [Minicystis rosea]|nr:Hypothetical protein A7982_07231 [Minicystis rosea]